METLDTKLWVLGSVIVTMMVLERLFPKARPLAAAGLRTAWDRLLRVLKNASLLLISTGLSPLVVIPLSALASTHALGWRPEWMSGWQGLIIDLLILDFWIYWWHRANHEIPFLWRFHEVHHLDEFLDASSAFRFHFGEVMLSAVVRASVIWLMDIPLTSVILFETMVLSMALFHHSNVALPGWVERPLSKIIVTPSIHWVHHHAIRADTDSNYANTLAFWDILFSSRSKTKRWNEMPIGVQTRHDEGLFGLLTWPFRSHRK